MLSEVDTDRLGHLPRPRPPGLRLGGPGRGAGPLRAAGLPVVKVQVSAALEAADPVGRRRRRCAEYVEPRFLHQTRSAGGAAADDLRRGARPRRLPGPWRVHYHVPLHADPSRR